MEASLRASLRALHAGRHPAPQRLRPAFLASLAATLTAAAAVIGLLGPARPDPGQAPRTAWPEAEFAPLLFGEPLDGADAVYLARVRVERSALASFGFPAADDELDGPPVEAEVLIGQDGLARGIRFVSDDDGD
jgi:hypothetical protein